MALSQITLTVDVSPRAKKTEIIKEEPGYIKIRLHAIPDRGRANDELVKFLSQHFKIPKSNITITAGLTSKRKLITMVSTQSQK